jgi:hypothetical protein
MSSKGVDRFPSQSKLAFGTDWYAMKTDGSGVKRLSTMNINRKENPENAGYTQVACTLAMGPSGDLALADVLDSVATQTGMIRRVHFTCP